MLGHLGSGSATQSPKLRLAEPDDAAVLSRIDQSCYEDYLPEDSYRSLLWTAGLSIRIIRNEYGHSAGLVVTENSRDKIEIVRLAVRPVDRRAGLASMAIRTMQKNITRRGVVVAKVELTGSMVPALRLLASHGFYGRLVPQADVVRFEWREPFSLK